jgi:hypothetical protein|tara:strand:- start:53 stop:424 length:372 start_codon:yes stop_codon:yes gene_type:complete
MNKWLLLLMLVSPTVARAELVTPNFTQGSMQSTTTTTQEIVETVETTTYGSAIDKWTGENVEVDSATSGGISASDAIFSIVNEADPFTLEITTRAASQVLSVTEIDREIDTTSTTTSLSVFSQ